MMKKAIFVIFLLAILLAPAAFAQSISIVSGNGQVVREQFLSVPLVVQVKDAAGNPSAGVNVTWSVTQGAGTISSQTNKTDAKGQASASFLSTGIQPGSSFVPNTVTATSPAGSVNFQITTTLGQNFALPPLVEVIKPTAENRKLSGPAGTVLTGALEIQVTAQSGIDAGRPVPNVAVRIVDNLDPTGPSPATCNVPGGVLLTNAVGRAVCDVMLTGTPGTYQLVALVGEYQFTQPIILTVTNAPVCNFTVTLSNTSFGANASSATINVATGSGCGWTATSNTSWITIAAPGSGSGNGSAVFSIAANTGAARSGTVLVAGRTLTMTQGASGTGSTTLAITSQQALASGTLNSFYSTALTASGGQTPYTWSVSGGLPPGLSLNPSTGLISGTPTATGGYNIAASVTDAAGTSRSQIFTFTVVAQSAGPVITNGSLPNGAVGVPYNQVLTSSGGCSSPFSPVPVFRIASGTLPTGLTLNAASGASYSISGTPTAAGTTNLVLTVTDSCAHSSSASFVLTITSGAGTSDSILVVPSTLTFNIQQGGTRPPDQTLSLSGATGGALSFTALGAASLLSVTPGFGTTPATLSVGVSTTSLSPGTYNTSIAVAAAGTSGVITVPVTVNVTPGTTLTVSPSSLVFRDATPQLLTVTGGGNVHFTVSVLSSANWLTVNPLGGDTPATLSVSANLNGLTTGSYNGVITLQPTGGPAVNVSVSLIVPPPATLDANPKTVTFTHLAGSELPEPFRQIIVATSGGPVNFTALADQPWIALNPASGTAPGTIGISVTPSRLAPGSYTGKVQLTPGPAITVNLTVAPPIPSPAAVTNAASFATGPVSPGEFVTLFGTGIGPTTPAGLRLTPSGLVDTQLGDTRVLFDGTPAPLVYVSGTQVSAIVPYEVFGMTATKIQVEYKGTLSAAIELRVAEAVPAVFPGAVLNEDSSQNLPQNGAEPGSIVVFYATGEGQTVPGGLTGSVTGDVLPKALANVSVQIGGRNADVLYAGAAPGLPSGVLQVNARVPDGVQRGADVPLTLMVGNASSPAGTVVSIRP